MADLFDLFDPRSYLLFIETAKRPTGKWRPGADTVNATLVVEPFRKFMHKRSRSKPDSDLLMMDVAVADQLSAFLRHPTDEEVESAGIDVTDLIYIQRIGASLEYRLVRPEPGQKIKR
jgi:hypothetical protein